MRVIAALLAWSLVEIGLFVVVGGAIGVWATWGVVLGSGLLGISLLRGQRVAVVRAEDLAGPLAHGALRMLAGLLLILPGFLTDAIGLCLLVPAVRQAVIDRLRNRLGLRFRGEFSADIVEGEAVEIQPEKLSKPSGWTKP